MRDYLCCGELFLADIYPDLDDETYQALATITPIYILLAIVRGYNAVHGSVLYQSE